MTPLLFVVARNQPQIYEHLARSLSGNEYIHVVIDRRLRERRRAGRRPDQERRRADRRVRPHEPAEFYPLGYTIVRRSGRPTWLRRLGAATSLLLPAPM